LQPGDDKGEEVAGEEDDDADAEVEPETEHAEGGVFGAVDFLAVAPCVFRDGGGREGDPVGELDGLGGFAVSGDEEALGLCEADGEPVCDFGLPLIIRQRWGPEEFLLFDEVGGHEGDGAELIDNVPDGGGDGGVLEHHCGCLLHVVQTNVGQGSDVRAAVVCGEVAPLVPAVEICAAIARLRVRVTEPRISVGMACE